MAGFLARRLIVSLVLLFLSTILMYTLVAYSGDPLADLRGDQSPNKQQRIDSRTQTLELGKPVPERYVSWLAGAARCAVPGLTCDLGQTRNDQSVVALLGAAVSSSLSLVSASVVLALVLGVGIGIVSALRQYSVFDYTLTFAAFLFFSLPVFWVAVLLKQYAAIGLNDWLADPVIPTVIIAVLAVLGGLVWSSIVGGDRQRRMVVFAVAVVATIATLSYLSAVSWFAQPALGPAAVVVVSLAIGLVVTLLGAGIRRRGVLYTSLLSAGVVAVAGAFLGPWLQDSATWWLIGGLAVAAAAVGAATGAALGGLDRMPAIRAGVLSALLAGGVVFVDLLLRAMPSYSDRVSGRIVATVGERTPNFSGTFWEVQLDLATHLILPTAALILISFATYTRFTRSSMLEVLNADYVRTARSKGLTERTVVVNHAFRNALIPVATLAAIDFGSVLGGAVITETVFARKGLGSLLIESLRNVDPNPVMGCYLVLAVGIVVFNMLADITYAYLDPRIRLS